MKPKWLCRFSIILTVWCAIVLPASAQQSQDWWFDVEIILFKRVLNTQIDENFANASDEFEHAAQRDLMSLSLSRYSDALLAIRRSLPSCDPNENAVQSTGVDDVFASLLLVEPKITIQRNLPVSPLPTFDKHAFDTSLSCVNHALPQFSKKVPLQFTDDVIGANQGYVKGKEQIVSSDYLRLGEFAELLFARRDIQPLLHTVWRQNVVFGENRAEFFALKAGDKLILPQRQADMVSKQTISRHSIGPRDSFAAVLNALEDDIANQSTRNWDDKATQSTLSAEVQPLSETDRVFEIEGRIKVYLQNINRIPYLHVDADILHHQISVNDNGMTEIQSFPFEQRRRIISKQIHYFDHPAFGMIIRLERYDPSAIDES